MTAGLLQPKLLARVGGASVAVLSLSFMPMLLGLLYFCSDLNGLWSIKYFLAFVGSECIFILIVFGLVFLDLKSLLALFIASYPVFVWGESVFVIYIGDQFFPLYFFILLAFLPRLVACLYLKGGRIGMGRIEAPIWIALFFFCMVKLLFIPLVDVRVLMTDGVLPLLYLFVLFLFRGSMTSDEWKTALMQGLVFLIVVVLAVALLEIVIRSHGHPELFLLKGARRQLAGTEGDVTGGMGEPVTLGLWAASFLLIGLLIRKAYPSFPRWSLVALAWLVVFSVSRGPILMLLFILLYLSRSMKARERFLFYLFLAFVGYLYLGAIQEKLGVAGDLPHSKVSLGGLSLDLELNAARYLLEITSWMDSVYQAPWFVQAALLPFIGGESFLRYFEVVPWALPVVGGVLFYLFLVSFRMIRKANGPSAAFVVFILLYYYYGAFSSTALSFLDIGLPARLGYVPREAPQYLFILFFIYLVAFAPSCFWCHGVSGKRMCGGNAKIF